MKVEMVNKLTGSRMWVADDRVEEYKAAGHKLAASSNATEKKPASKPRAKKAKK